MDNACGVMILYPGSPVVSQQALDLAWWMRSTQIPASWQTSWRCSAKSLKHRSSGVSFCYVLLFSLVGYCRLRLPEMLYVHVCVHGRSLPWQSNNWRRCLKDVENPFPPLRPTMSSQPANQSHSLSQVPHRGPWDCCGTAFQWHLRHGFWRRILKAVYRPQILWCMWLCATLD